MACQKGWRDPRLIITKSFAKDVTGFTDHDLIPGRSFAFYRKVPPGSEELLRHDAACPGHADLGGTLQSVYSSGRVNSPLDHRSLLFAFELRLFSRDFLGGSFLDRFKPRLLLRPRLTYVHEPSQTYSLRAKLQLHP